MGKDKNLDILSDNMSLDELDSLIDGLEDNSEGTNLKLDVSENSEIASELDDIETSLDLGNFDVEESLSLVDDESPAESLLSEEPVAAESLPLEKPVVVEAKRQKLSVYPELQISIPEEETVELQMAQTEERVKRNLVWYSGTLKDKSYDISFDNMPEFLEPDNEISVINVMLDRGYGWNVFFNNGVFMSLRDLKEYQVRNGKMPDSSGRIIYSNKTISFERIKRVVVYEKPMYFVYQVR